MICRSDRVASLKGTSYWAAWQAARVEVEQRAEAQEALEHPVEDRVVEKIVEETTLEPAAATNGRRVSVSA
jgi:hypothetical protein